jgi:hypothetical protein
MKIDLQTVSVKRERFVRISEARKFRAIQSIRLIRNLANSTVYEYSADEFESIVRSLANEVNALSNVFSQHDSNFSDFSKYSDSAPCGI